MTDVAQSAGVFLAWAALFLGVLLILAYRRSSLALSSGVLGMLLLAYLALGSAPVWWKIVVSLPYALLLLLNIRPLRRRAVTRPFLRRGTYDSEIPVDRRWRRDGEPGARIVIGNAGPQIDCAIGQRVRNLHPDGGSAADGTSPSTALPTLVRSTWGLERR